MTGDVVTAEEALTIGLVNPVVPLDQLQDATQALANKLLTKPPMALRRTKEFFAALHTNRAEDLTYADAHVGLATLASEDMREVWLNDDGKEEGDEGSRLLAIDTQGKVSILVDANKMMPISAGFDIAPDDFGPFGGQVFALSQPKVGDKGGLENYVVQRIDLKNNYVVIIFCTLPSLSKKKVSGIGVDASFGPTGSPFAGKLYASTTLNETIYQITPDGKCSPFVTLDPKRHGGSHYLRFAPDGKSLLVTVVCGGIFAACGSAVLRILSNGTIDERPLVEAPTLFGSLDFVPAGFGQYAGQLFVVDVGYYEIPVPLGQALRVDGKIHRVTPEGKLELVASGFINHWNLRFVGNTRWVADINGDFI